MSDQEAVSGPKVVRRRNPEPHEMPALMVHLEEKVLVDELATEYGFLNDVLIQEQLDQLSSTEEWRWEIYQRRYFKTVGNYACNKCRQSGLSAGLGAKKTAAGILNPDEYTAVIVSYKKEEAIGKIDYVKKFLAALPPEFEKEEVRSPRQLVEWRNYNGTRAKIISHAQKPVRGAAGDVGLDELGFYQHAQLIYESSLPVIAQAGGVLDVISTPFGKGGTYYEIMVEKAGQDSFYREVIFWWLCMRYLKVPTLEYMIDVARLATTEDMDTAKRVKLFGSHSIIMQFEDAKFVDSFRQEFECYFIDDAVSFFSRDLILNCMFTNKSDLSDYEALQSDFEEISVEEALADISVEEAGGKRRAVELYHHGAVDSFGAPIRFRKYFHDAPRASESFGELQDLLLAIRIGEVSDNLFVGLDIGKTVNSTVLTIIEEVYPASGGVLQIERGAIEFQNMPLHEQEAKLERVLDILPWVRGVGDSGGLGEHMCGSFEAKYPGRFEGINFSTGGLSKIEPIMVNLRARMSNYSIALSYDKKLLSELHSIQRELTESGRISYKAPEQKGSHADRAYSLALACWAGTVYDEAETRIDPSMLAVPRNAIDDSRIESDPIFDFFGMKGINSEAALDDEPFDATDFGLFESMDGFDDGWDV